MDVIAIYPAFNDSINEMAMVWKKLCKNGIVRCFVVTGKNDVLKKCNSTLFYENAQGLEIHRFNTPLKSNVKAITLLAKKIKPQLIFCAVSYNMPIALMIQKHTNAPIILHTEYFLNMTKILTKRHYLCIKFLLPIVHHIYKKWCFEKTTKILSSDPSDFNRDIKDQGQELRYLPWPHPTNHAYIEYESRDVNSAVYIGSLSKWKGVVNLYEFYAHLLINQPDCHLTIIGPVLDSEAKKAIKLLKQFGEQRVKVKEFCSRSEAIDLIAKAFFIFSPLDSMGWGLIGDAWTVGTPVLSIGEHYDLKDGINCYITPNPNDFVFAVRDLSNNRVLWQKLSKQGLITAQSHSLEVVASKLQNELQYVVDLIND